MVGVMREWFPILHPARNIATGTVAPLSKGG